MMLTMDYQAFLSKIQKRGSKPHHISHCYGSRDAWKWVMKNKWKALGGKPFDQLLYSKIINTVNLCLAEQLLEGHEIIFPYKMGSLSLLKVPREVKIVDGVVKDNYAVDWKKTLEYWYNDEEGRKSGIRIKKIENYRYVLNYKKDKASYKNMRFYSFRANRGLSRERSRLAEERVLHAESVNY